MKPSVPSFRLCEIAVTGISAKPAVLAFEEGLNILYGPSDTGKTYVLEAISYCMGRSERPKQIPEAEGYSHAVLTIRERTGKYWTIRRHLTEGNAEVFEGQAIDGSVEALGRPRTLRQKHSKASDNSISSFLIRLFGAEGRHIRTNESGKTEILTFPAFRQLTVVEEERIIARKSPFSSGERGDDTKFRSVLRYILTGEDDSSVIAQESDAIKRARTDGRTEILEEVIGDLKRALAEVELHHHEEAETIDLEIKRVEEQLARLREQLAELEGTREREWYELQKKKSRALQIQELVSRFGLLKSHYESDLARLAAVVEASTVLGAYPQIPCILCGRSTEHDTDFAHENVPHLVQGCEAERMKILSLRTGLLGALSELEDELVVLQTSIVTSQAGVDELSRRIEQNLRPPHAELVQTLSVLVNQRLVVERRRLLESQLRQLQTKHLVLEISSEADRIDDTQGTVLEGDLWGLIPRIESLLNSWRFPGRSVAYDRKVNDIVIGGKRRIDHGKGHRAIAYAACTIALMLHVQDAGRHPGFVILDSPLNPYRKGVDDDGANSIDVKRFFYKTLVPLLRNRQVLVIENEQPEGVGLDEVHRLEFTKSARQGRYGFIPR